MNKKIEGVFLLERDSRIGTGHTRRTVRQQMYCRAQQVSDTEVEVQYLDGNDQPIGDPELVPKEQFVRNYTFQPYYLERKKQAAAQAEDQKLNKHIALAEEHARRKEYYSAEYEYRNALTIDEDNLRANFGIGNVYLEMGETGKAKDIFVKISQLDAIFEEKNKHFFNECGIQLRKQGLFDEAIDFYQTACKIAPEDEDLLFNIARASYEKEDFDGARGYLDKVLAVNPSLAEGRALLRRIELGIGPQADPPS